MIGYTTLGTNDIKRGAEFYDKIAAEMGTPRMMGSEDDGFIAWGTMAGSAISIIKPFDGGAPSVGNGTMVAPQAKDAAKVKCIYDMAISMGGTCEGPPGPRGESGFYAAYFRDLDSHKLNAFCMAAEDAG